MAVRRLRRRRCARSRCRRRRLELLRLGRCLQCRWILANGPLHGWIYAFRNQGTTAKPAYAEPFFVEAHGSRVDTFGCPSPNFEDFDSDGDLDLLCGEFLDGFTYFENVGSRVAP